MPATEPAPPPAIVAQPVRPTEFALRVDISGFSATLKTSYAAHKSNLPDDFSTTNCPYVVTFRTTKLTFVEMLYGHFFKDCVKEPKYRHVNPTAVIFHRSTTDNQLQFIYVRDADAVRIIVQSLQKAHHLKLIPILGDLRQMENAGYDTDTSEEEES